MGTPLPWAAWANARPLFSKDIFPNIYPKPTLMHLEAIASRPVAGYLGAHPPLTPPSWQGAAESEKVSPQPPPD